LTKLLEFVKELYGHPDNVEFTDGIRDMVLNDKDVIKALKKNAEKEAPAQVVTVGNDASFKKVEKYLSLDYELDGEISPDYSFVDNDRVLKCLMSDFREMLRYRYGTRSHKIDFPEFCRFALLQIEMLINYYYECVYIDYKELIEAIKYHNSKAEFSSKIKNIADIPLKNKLFQLLNESNWGSMDLQVYLNIIDVRNEQSHRSLFKGRRR